MPDSVGQLKQLTTMEIISSEIQHLPIGVREMDNLEFLKVDSTPLLYMPFVNKVVTGKMLSTETPVNKCMVGLKYLELNKTRISELSFAEGICPNIQHLKIDHCNDLVEVGTLPTSLITLEMRFCDELRKIRGLCGLAKLQRLDISGCQQVRELPSLEKLTSLEESRACECKQLKSIRGLAQLAKLRLLDVKKCCEMKELAGIQSLRSLEKFHYSSCPKLQVSGEVLKHQPQGPRQQVGRKVPMHLLAGAPQVGKDPRGMSSYTIDNYYGLNTDNSYFGITSELFEAIDGIMGISDWLKVM